MHSMVWLTVRYIGVRTFGILLPRNNLHDLSIHRDNGKENGNYRGYKRIIGHILGLYWDDVRV